MSYLDTSTQLKLLKTMRSTEKMYYLLRCRLVPRERERERQEKLNCKSSLNSWMSVCTGDKDKAR